MIISAANEVCSMGAFSVGFEPASNVGCRPSAALFLHPDHPRRRKGTAHRHPPLLRPRHLLERRHAGGHRPARWLAAARARSREDRPRPRPPPRPAHDRRRDFNSRSGERKSSLARALRPAGVPQPRFRHRLARGIAPPAPGSRACPRRGPDEEQRAGGKVSLSEVQRDSHARKTRRWSRPNE